MGHTWIIAVLDDLRTYAEINDLPRLSASLRAVAAVAEEETALAAAGTPVWARGDGTGPGRHPRADRGGASPS